MQDIYCKIYIYISIGNVTMHVTRCERHHPAGVDKAMSIKGYPINGGVGHVTTEAAVLIK